jgi:hypothetical protein
MIRAINQYSPGAVSSDRQIVIANNIERLAEKSQGL